VDYGDDTAEPAGAKQINPIGAVEPMWKSNHVKQQWGCLMRGAGWGAWGADFVDRFLKYLARYWDFLGRFWRNLKGFWDFLSMFS
jgi:hypothetical protein